VPLQKLAEARAFKRRGCGLVEERGKKGEVGGASLTGEKTMCGSGGKGHQWEMGISFAIVGSYDWRHGAGEPGKRGRTGTFVG